MTTAERLVERLRERKMTCATAESCTGGGVGFAITSVAGASEVFSGGVISYSNEVKHEVLGVSSETLAAVGAVSSEVAAQMADGARRLLKTDLAVSLTGIAGPGGGTSEKPVGLVWFGLSTPLGAHTERVIFTGDRAAVRTQAITHALDMLLAAVST